MPVQTNNQTLQTRVKEIKREALDWEEFQFKYKTKAARHPIYPLVLDIARTDPAAVYLDIGCFTGTDLRKLVRDGWDGRNVMGLDSQPEWFKLGYKLYKDDLICPIKFLTGNVLSPLTLPSEISTSREIRCISLFSFFHLFSNPEQTFLARTLAQIILPSPGSIIFGSHRASRTMGSKREEGDRVSFYHSPSSWKELWEHVFPPVRGEPRVRVICEFLDLEGSERAQGEGERGMMWWSVELL